MNIEKLKSREIEIVKLMADGLTNREIAERLFLGVETVRTYAKRIYSKLDVSGREEAADKAQELGLLDDNPKYEKTNSNPKHNLPLQLSSFIGREEQIADIISLLSEKRLLTLMGTGGTGKTRLSLKVGEALLEHFQDGVYFVDLAPINDSKLVARSIAQTLGIIESAEQIVDTLKRAIGQRELLLILDNYEHVIETAPLVSDLLSGVPNAKIIVTSREALHVSGETIYDVPSLSSDDEYSEAVALFLHRSQAVKTGFEINRSNSDAIIEICKHLDGLPLAIELAAVQSRFLTPDAILSRLDKRFQNLRGGSRDAPQRQQTLKATIDWSYDLLEAEEKLLLARLSVFRGGRSLEAIEAICGEHLERNVLDILAALVDKSMMRQIEDELGEPRFVVLETIQEYALQRLAESGEREDMLKRHAQYFMELAERAAPELSLAQQEWWYSKLDIEYNNLRTAMTWALSDVSQDGAEIGLRTIAAMRDYWLYQGNLKEGWALSSRAMEYLDDVSAPLQANVLVTVGMLTQYVGDIKSSQEFLRKTLVIYQELDDIRNIAWTRLWLSSGIVHDYDRQKYRENCELALATFRELDDKVGIARALNHLGVLCFNQGDTEQAIVVYQECIGACRLIGDRRREAIIWANLGTTATQKKDAKRAAEVLHHSLELAWDINFRFLIFDVLGRCVGVFVLADKAELAARVYGGWQRFREISGFILQPISEDFIEGYVEATRQQLIEDEFQLAREQGYAMSLEDIVAFALLELAKIASG